MARDDSKTVLEGQAAIDLWLQGKEIWNKWVEENPIADVDFAKADFAKYDTVSFEGYKFPKGYVSFIRAKFGEGRVSFSGAQFGKGGVSFYNTQFGEGRVSFMRAKFGEGNVYFSGAKFDKGDVSFFNTQFGEGKVDFSGAQFGEGRVDFSGAKFGEGRVDFSFAKFDKGDVSFVEAKFDKGDVSFMRARFGEGSVNFYNTQFGEGRVSFIGTKFGESNVSFIRTKFGEGDISFRGAQFGEGRVSFMRAKFGEGNVYFSNTKFGEGDVSFTLAKFGEGDVSFNGLKLEGQFNFSDVEGTEQIKSLSFKFATFDGPVSLDGNSFNCIPDFTNTKLTHQLSLSHFTTRAKKTSKGKAIPIFFALIQTIWSGSPIQYSKAKSALKLSRKLSRKLPWLSKTAAADKQDIDRIRRLKELAETNKHHKLALDLHVEEMKCSRWIETPWHQLLTEFLFQKLGDYGRSIFRPTLSLVLLWLTCAPIYAYSSDKKDITYDALLFSFSQMFSIIPSSKDARSESSAALYGTLVNDKLVVDIPHAVFAVAGFQSLASIALVFLIGLALRNRFRI
ncbi:hypothetical protein CWC22_022960 [Pseudoalteromonas rubra]|uniref:Pentapeptide repeat-containing protein n=1 Tax=Pseudoalteromonas rubra TaxID=43658 RepID=A0A5S3V235_9GAMM|nr:hypothetical protein [Pseudoalteromonas rubra]QPB85864.1 hypothetical protein CWC22_022960 [Pseudoalteromonas rubra]